MLYSYLYDWQKEIVDKFKDRKEFGLFLDMGCGKTLISLALAEIQKCDKILIVSVNKKALEDENVQGSFFEWLSKSNIKYNLYNKKYSFRNEGAKKWRREISPETKDVLLINYEGLYKPGQSVIKNDKKRKRCVLSNIVEDFVESCKRNKVAIIVDESHKIKELDSLQTMAIKKIRRDLSLNRNEIYTYLLTGTPFTKGFIDLYSQLKFLGWEGNKTLFEDAFCVKGDLPGLLGWQQPIIAYKNVDKLYDLIHKYAITIKTEKVVKLPDKIFVNHTLPNSNEMNLLTCEKIKKEYIEEFVNKYNLKLPYDLNESVRNGKINNPFYRNIAFPSLKWIADTAGTFWMRARQMSIGFQGNDEEFCWYNRDRLNELKTLLEDHEDNYIIFYNYEPEFLEIFDICYELGYNIDVCNGTFKSEYFYNRYAAQDEGTRLINKKNVVLANFKSGSAGSNWQLYNKCVLFSIPLFEDYQQSIKRVHRIGQKETVIYHIFSSDNWLDRSMFKTLKELKQYDKDMFENDLKISQTLV